MSAFVLSKKHIDAMLTFAVNYNRGEGMHLYGLEDKPVHLRLDQQNELNRVGQELVNQNVRSVNYRYRASEHIDQSEPDIYTFAMYRKPLSPVEILKACQCYDYQACETDDYQETKAAKLVETIRHYAINSLPGYDKAQWGIDD